MPLFHIDETFRVEEMGNHVSHGNLLSAFSALTIFGEPEPKRMKSMDWESERSYHDQLLSGGNRGSAADQARNARKSY